MIWRALVIFSIFHFISGISWAEYRAFTLVFKDSEGNIVREINSNLDPDQYRAFFPIDSNLTLSYVDTWLCPGRTNLLPICPSPKLAEPQVEPANPPSDQNPSNP